MRKYIYSPGVDEPLCMIDVEDSNSIYYYHFDGLGSVVALSDTAGDTVQTYEYSIYGQVAASDPNHPNPYLFTGRRFDTETGLYYYRARYYNPYIGCFMQTDPVGYGEGLNLYTYCGNNPVGCIDPSGCRILKSYHIPVDYPYIFDFLDLIWSTWDLVETEPFHFPSYETVKDHIENNMCGDTLDILIIDVYDEEVAAVWAFYDFVYIVGFVADETPWTKLKEVYRKTDGYRGWAGTCLTAIGTGLTALGTRNHVATMYAYTYTNVGVAFAVTGIALTISDLSDTWSTAERATAPFGRLQKQRKLDNENLEWCPICHREKMYCDPIKHMKHLRDWVRNHRPLRY